MTKRSRSTDLAASAAVCCAPSRTAASRPRRRCHQRSDRCEDVATCCVTTRSTVAGTRPSSRRGVAQRRRGRHQSVRRERPDEAAVGRARRTSCSSAPAVTDYAGCEHHLKAGAKRVLLSAPAKGESDGEILTVVYGINHTQYDPSKHKVLSTRRARRMPRADREGRERHLQDQARQMTRCTRTRTIRRFSICRTRTASRTRCGDVDDPDVHGVRRPSAWVIPELKGKLDGYAIRVSDAGRFAGDHGGRSREEDTKTK